MISGSFTPLSASPLSTRCWARRCDRFSQHTGDQGRINKFVRQHSFDQRWVKGNRQISNPTTRQYGRKD